MDSTQVTDATTTQSVNDEEDAAFAAGFAQQTGQEPPGKGPAVPEKSAADVFSDEAARQPAPEAAPAAPESSTAGAVQSLPTDEMTAIKARLSDVDSMRQGLDKLAGTVGGINRTLQELRQIQAATATTATPEGAAAARAARKIERALLAELDSDYPDIVDKLLPGVERIMQATGAVPAADDRVTALEQQNQRLADQIRRAEFRELERQHPNWQAELALKDEHGSPVKDEHGRIRPSREFSEFFGSKPAEWQKQFMDAEEADFVSAAMTEFKQHRATPAPAVSGSPAPVSAPTPTPAPAPNSGLSSKQQRLRQAMTPAGAPAATPAVTNESEDDALVAGFKAVRGGSS